jgi:PIN domain nuclease of toxin-antitoxin system
MKILLDTHIFLWSLQDSSKLSEECKKLIKNADKVFISTASMWEISIKISVGKFNDINLETL